MITVATLYQFTPLTDLQALRDRMTGICADAGLKGTLILAEEGINGTIAGDAAGMAAVLAAIRTLPGCGDVRVRMTEAEQVPFGRMKVKVKREIVTMGVPGTDPQARTGRHVEARDWAALIAQDDVVLIDTRNRYEVAEGTFAGAVNPDTASFREFPAWWRQNRDRFAGRRIAMFCTGGIRCEKATSLALAEGADEVFHLKGGILSYLDAAPPGDTLWHGRCFVFDEREAE
jgi:UPF0176 protein